MDITPHKHETLRAYNWRLASYGLHTKSCLGFDAEQNPNSFFSFPSHLNHHLVRSKFRYCPFCLSEHPYFCAQWDIALMPFCLKHDTLLFEAPKQIGGRFIEVWAARGERDKCDLPHLTELQMRWANWVQGKLIGTEEQDCPETYFVSSSVKLVLDLMLLLGAYDNYPLLDKPRKCKFVSNIGVALAVVNSGIRLVKDWPFNVFEFLSSVSETSDRNAWQLYRRIDRLLGRDKAIDARDALKEEVARQWPTKLPNASRSMRGYKAFNDLQFVTLTELAKESGFSSNTIANVINDEALEVRKAFTGNKRNSIVLWRGDLQCLRELGEAIDLIQASKVLGQSETNIRQLLNENLLEEFPRQGKGIHRIKKQSLNSLLSQLSENCTLVNTTEREELVNLDELARFYLPHYVNTADAISATLKGDLTGYCYDKLKGDLGHSLFFDLEDMKAWLYPKGLLSIPDVAAELRVKSEVAYHLVNAGLIRCQPFGRLGRFVGREELDAFTSKFVFLRDIAKAQGTSPRHMKELLLDRGIEPVTGPSVDGGRQYVYLAE